MGSKGIGDRGDEVQGDRGRPGRGPRRHIARRRLSASLKLAALAALGVVAAVALVPGPAGGAQAHQALPPPVRPPITSITVISLFYSVAVSVSGPGSVSSSPSGISCGSTCSASFTNGSSVTLSATPNSGIYQFNGWSGSCSGTGTCTVSSAANVTASFGLRSIATLPILTISTLSVPTTYSLTVAASGSGSVSSSPSGISCPGTCSASFAIGTSVTLHATPGSGNVITGWSGGGCSGTGSSCTVTSGGTVSVTFAAPAPTSTATSTTTGSSQPVIVSTPTSTVITPSPTLLAIKIGVTGSGTVTGTTPGGAGIACGANGSTCFGTYKPGATISLRAAPVTGFRFGGWSGGCTGMTITCRLKVQKASTISARFISMPSAAIVPVQIDAAAFSVSWNQSIGTGKLLVHGRIAKTAQVDVQLARSGGGKLVSERLSLPAGHFSIALKLDPALGLIPGGFVVTISGKSGHLSVPPQVKTLSLASPPGGVVGRAFASASANGAPTATLHAKGKQAFVTFDFKAQPPRGQSLTVAWFEPGGKLLGQAAKSSAPTITSSVKSNGPLPRGAWHVDLRYGKTLVKTVTINVQ